MPEQIEKKDELEEAILTERKSLEYNAKDEDLARAINSAVKESKKLKEIADKIGKKNELYWEKGTDLDRKKIHPKRAKIIINRIFTSVETVVSIVTSRPPEPTIIGEELENVIREKLIKILTIAYEVKQKLKQKLQKIIRHWFLYRIGVWKYRWDGGFITETVRPEKIGFDPRAPETGDCEYMFEWLEDTIGNLIKEYPKKKKAILEKYGKDKLKSKVKYLEFWGGNAEWVAWKLGTIILDKQKNPNFDYGELAKKAKGEEGEEGYEEAVEAKEGTNNLFKKPQFPYLILNVFNLGKNLYDDTSLIEQSIPLQDAANKRKNQISDLTEENKKLIVASSKAISKEDFQEFIDKYGMVGIWLDRGEISDIKVEGGHADASTHNDLTQSLLEIDNIMATHGSSRGERQKTETATGRKILVAGDYGRAETIIVNIEELMEDWYNAFLHMTKVYSTEDSKFSNSEETIVLNKEEIPEGVLVMVKKGSTLPVDKASRAEMALNLAKIDKIDPETMFDEVGYGNAEERTDKLFEWLEKTGKTRPEGMPAGGAGAGAQDPRIVQLAKVKKIMTSTEFKKLPVKQQQATITKAREIVKQIKGG